MAVIAIGDLQLSNHRPWSYEVSNRIVDMIISHPTNDKNNIAVFLGDVTEHAILSGDLISLLMKLFSGLLYKKIYVIVGNHELKMNKVGEETYILDFLRGPLFPRVEIISECSSFVEGDDSYLFLPWFNAKGGSSMKEVYESLKSPPGQKPYTAIFGHLQESSLGLPGESVNLSHIPAKFLCLGHIHSPSEMCLGSVVPNSISEAGFPRRFQSFSNGRREDIPIPNIMDYYDVIYPNPLPEVNCEIPIYTILNCSNEETAKGHYGNIYIKKCSYDASIKLDSEAGSEKSIDFSTLNPISLFSEFKESFSFSPPELKNLAEKYFTGASLT